MQRLFHHMASFLFFTLVLGFSFFAFAKVSYALPPLLGPTPFCDPATQLCHTAIGDISYDITPGTPNGFFDKIVTLSVGFGGAIALLLMIYGFYIITTSSGMPDKIKEGQQIISSAASGLVMIVLSVFLLNLIGIKIIGLPGLQ